MYAVADTLGSQFLWLRASRVAGTGLLPGLGIQRIPTP